MNIVAKADKEVAVEVKALEMERYTRDIKTEIGGHVLAGETSYEIKEELLVCYI